MKFFASLLVICLSIVFVAGQRFFFGQAPNRVQRQFNFNSLDYPQPSSARDPRQDRGPVVFPPSPPDAIDESSGVVVGASGFGFVPPSQSQYYTSALETPAALYTSYNYFSTPYTTRISFI